MGNRLLHFLQIAGQDTGNKAQRALHNVLDAGQHISHWGTGKAALFYDGVYDLSKDIPHKVQQIGQQFPRMIHKVGNVVQCRAPIPGEYVADKRFDISKNVGDVLSYLFQPVSDFI